MTQKNKVADALTRGYKVVESRDNIHVVHTSELSRTDRELLLRGGWLQEIIKGWYLLVRPEILPGESSAWYATFWDFLHVYLTHFYGEEYCLSAAHSLDLHLGITVIPRQVDVMS